MIKQAFKELSDHTALKEAYQFGLAVPSGNEVNCGVCAGGTPES
jgi:hypothetical protein